MIYNVAALLSGELGISRVYSIEDESITHEGGDFHGISGSVKLTRTDRGILLRGKATGAGINECARCLETAVTVLHTVVEDEYFPVNGDLGPGSSLLRQEIVEEEEIPEFWIDEANDLDTSEALRQGFISETPLVNLCKPDCAGICPECGNNQNTNPCECEVRNIDPRLAGLLDLKI
ncbi:MAG: DUF177 domain-containing protein [Chloroflexi bacterium]|jgi:uncharacterized protein|nr:DUF177 domain-containing protein [Chloroflexota bacterium]MBT4074420.1 DUF177 domain-containing protein [Chloroflexota bacterium]MBT4514670.1 DUF177 domain-containing protein [Chloroflexota bacterium]MBT5319974.1 DUF177 domain-containing protein [Chloroflexota bacterium]MBT6680914.1 DUF177 domain-containing protein [Chloroflexota bacterium]